MIVDDIVVCGGKELDTTECVDTWRKSLEERRMRLSRPKTQYVDFAFERNEQIGNREPIKNKMGGTGMSSSFQIPRDEYRGVAQIDLVRACDEERRRTHTEESVEGRYTREKEERTTENKMERRQRDLQSTGLRAGEETDRAMWRREDHQSYRRPYMLGKARGKVSR